MEYGINVLTWERCSITFYFWWFVLNMDTCPQGLVDPSWAARRDVPMVSDRERETGRTNISNGY